ncbi:MAG: hypothetical protein ACO1QB_04445 [Verrucomicrobiales bacterium]
MNRLLLFPALLGLALFSGCTQGSHSDHDHHEESHHVAQGGTEHIGHGIEFKEGKGLFVPESTRKMLGIKVVDVEEGKGKRKIDLALRVFKSTKLDGKDIYLASATLNSREAQYLPPGSELDVQSPSGTRVAAKVVKIDQGSARLTGMPEVIVQLSGISDLEAGSFLNATTSVLQQEEVTVAPKEALLKTAEGHFVYVENGDHFFRTKIEIGAKDGEVIEVSEGLYAGDRLVLQPVMQLWMAELHFIRGGKACADGH